MPSGRENSIFTRVKLSIFLQGSVVNSSYVFFLGSNRIQRGSLESVVSEAKGAQERGSIERIAIYDEATGKPFDVDFSGSLSQVLERLEARNAWGVAPRRSGRGRPKLGVVSKEVSLLPRHWDWLKRQPKSASAVLRSLIDQARRSEDPNSWESRIEKTYSFCQDLAGDLPGFEEASRKLFAQDRVGFREAISSWPPDIQDQLEFFLGGKESLPSTE